MRSYELLKKMDSFDLRKNILCKRVKMRVVVGLFGLITCPPPDCPSQDEAVLCENSCNDDYSACVDNCGSDTVCSQACTRPYYICIDGTFIILAKK